VRRRPRRNHSPAFSAEVALEAIRGEVLCWGRLSQALWCALDSHPGHPVLSSLTYEAAVPVSAPGPRRPNLGSINPARLANGHT